MTKDYKYIEHTITSMSEFIERRIRSGGEAVSIYRGHCRSTWNLLPSLFRLESLPTGFHWNARDFEEKLMAEFQRQSRPYVQMLPANVIEWLTLAQHYGLPTRLLDWTTSPLNALFFAINDMQHRYDGEDGVVWGASMVPRYFKKEIPSSLPELDTELGSTKNCFLYYPQHITPRISAQQSCFTVHSAPTHMDFFEPLEDNDNLAQDASIVALVRYNISAENKPRLRRELIDLGISWSSLFPDLEGVVRQLVWDRTGNWYFHEAIQGYTGAEE